MAQVLGHVTPHNGIFQEDHQQFDQRFHDLIEQVQRQAVAGHLDDYADDIEYRHDIDHLDIWDSGYAQARRTIAHMTRRRAQQIRAGDRSLTNSATAVKNPGSQSFKS